MNAPRGIFRVIKGIIQPKKLKPCHHFLPRGLFQTCKTQKIIFWRMLVTKIWRGHWHPQYLFPYFGCQRLPSTVWLPLFFKISYFEERNSYSSETIWGWVNDDRTSFIIIFFNCPSKVCSLSWALAHECHWPISQFDTNCSHAARLQIVGCIYPSLMLTITGQARMTLRKVMASPRPQLSVSAPA